MANKIFNNLNLKNSNEFQIPEVQLNKVPSLLIPIDKLSNVLFDVEKEDPAEIIENRKLGISTPIILTLPKDNHGNDIQLTQFDKLIFWVVLSEQEAGNDCISLNRIFHAVGGGKHLDHAPILKVAIANSLDKLRKTDLVIDLRALAEKFNSYKNSLDTEENSKRKFILHGYLLPSEIITAEINGKVTDAAIHLLGKSLLLQVSEMKSQIVHCPPNLLAAPVRCTEQTLSIKSYLLERILKIKGSNNDKRNKRVQKLGNSILFDSLFNKCGLADENRHRKAEYRKSISKILDYFVEQKFISDYEFEKKDGKFYSIKISF